jgi:PAS domain-containing protein
MTGFEDSGLPAWVVQLLALVIATVLSLLFQRVRALAAAGLRYVVGLFTGARLRTMIVANHRDNTALIGALQAQVSYLTGQTTELLHEVRPNGGGSYRDESRRQYATLLGLVFAADCGQFILYADGTLEAANPVFLRWTGTTPDELEGRGLYGVVQQSELATFRAEFEAAIATGYPFRGVYTLRMFDATGTNYAKVQTDWLIAPLREKGRIVSWVGNVRRTVPPATANLRDALQPCEIGGDPS